LLQGVGGKVVSSSVMPRGSTATFVDPRIEELCVIRNKARGD
jgi:hypothetical protein